MAWDLEDLNRLLQVEKVNVLLIFKPKEQKNNLSEKSENEIKADLVAPKMLLNSKNYECEKRKEPIIIPDFLA